MASIYRRTRSYPIPSGAEIIERRRKATAAERLKDPHCASIVERWAKWVDKKGQTRKALVNADGDKVAVESGSYLISYYDADGIRQEVNSKTTDLATAERIAGQLENRAALRQAGIIDPTQERFSSEARRPLSEHAVDYRQYLRDKGNSEQHVAQATRQIQAIIDTLNAVHIRDLDGAAVMRVIGLLRVRKERPASLRTCNSYLRSIKSFTRWLWTEKRAANDALAALSQFNEETDRRHTRRELTPEELAYLLSHVEYKGKVNFRLAGPVRAMLYRVALGSGFRRKELRTLTPASFDLDSVPPTVTVAAAYSKRRRQDVQPIQPSLAELLRSWLAGRPRDERLFPLPHNTSKMFRRDLAAARSHWISEAQADDERQRREESDFLRYENAAGDVADFHAQRHTYISGLVAGGASVKTAQELARHSTPVLTIGRYSHTRLHDLQGALDALPDLATSTTTTTTPQAIAATGTDDLAGKMPANRQRAGCEIAQKDTGSCECPPTGNDNADCPNLLIFNDVSGNRRESAEWSGPGLNWRHTDFQSVALPTELPDRIKSREGVVLAVKQTNYGRIVDSRLEIVNSGRAKSRAGKLAVVLWERRGQSPKTTRGEPERGAGENAATFRRSRTSVSLAS